MKKKVLIISFIVLFLILTCLISGHYYLKYKQEKEHELLVATTKRKYNFFQENKLSKNNDELSIYFNTILNEKKKENAINFEQYLSSNVTLDKITSNDLLSLIDKEIDNYNIDILNTFNEKNLNKYLNDNIDKETILSIYNANNFIKDLAKEKNNRQNYLNSLTELRDYISFFINNQDKLIISNHTIVYKDDVVKAKLEDFKTKYNLDFTIKKEEVKENNNPTYKEIKGVPILCYHGVLNIPWGQASLFVKVDEFEKQMQYLSENGYTPLFVSEIASADKYDKPVILTFDDGYKDVYTNAFPILQKYNIKANIYMISGWINGDVYMTTDMMKEMANSPLIEIGSHTVNHKALASLSDEEIDNELKNSKSDLEVILNKNIDVIAYPTGSYDSRVLNIAKKYYKYGLSTNKGKENPQKLNTYNLKRIYVYRSYSIEQFKNLF